MKKEASPSPPRFDLMMVLTAVLLVSLLPLVWWLSVQIASRGLGTIGAMFWSMCAGAATASVVSQYRASTRQPTSLTPRFDHVHSVHGVHALPKGTSPAADRSGEGSGERTAALKLSDVNARITMQGLTAVQAPTLPETPELDTPELEAPSIPEFAPDEPVARAPSSKIIVSFDDSEPGVPQYQEPVPIYEAFANELPHDTWRDIPSAEPVDTQVDTLQPPDDFERRPTTPIAPMTPAPVHFVEDHDEESTQPMMSSHEVLRRDVNRPEESAQQPAFGALDLSAYAADDQEHTVEQHLFDAHAATTQAMSSPSVTAQLPHVTKPVDRAQVMAEHMMRVSEQTGRDEDDVHTSRIDNDVLRRVANYYEAFDPTQDPEATPAVAMPKKRE